MLNWNIPVYNEVASETKSLGVFGPNISNSLPCHIKSSENFESFKRIIKY